ncbi:MAG: glycolate oxidase subunit GlcF [Thiolinea sp.]
MHTELHPQLAGNHEAEEAKSIIQACVHCGFCTATCPTYQHFHDERDGPRGRIYLIKQLLENNEVSANTQKHLDRCLSCRSCETTCPSGVRYGRLVDIGRKMTEDRVPRSPLAKLQRQALRQFVPYEKRFGTLLKLGQIARPVLPAALKAKVPVKRAASPWPVNSHPRKMLALRGCAQGVATPNTNAAAARVLDKLGITLAEEPNAGCCGAVDYHLSAHEAGLNAMRKNIDAWWPAIEAGAEALVMTASGCGVMVKEYGELLAQDPEYAAKAKRVSELTKDISEVLLAEDLTQLKASVQTKTAFHCPCTLQHGLQLSGKVEQILQQVGVPLTKTKDKHLCCGSAGTYSILQAKTSQALLDKKLKALTIDAPEQIVTANVGCQLHLATKSEVPVKHWIELLA